MYRATVFRFCLLGGLCIQPITALSQSNGNFVDAYNRSGPAYRQDLACWGETTSTTTWACDVGDKPNIPGYGYYPVTRHYDCPGGGWDSNYACQDICGVPYDGGIHCGVYTDSNWGFGGKKCGYRWAMVQCYR